MTSPSQIIQFLSSSFQENHQSGNFVNFTSSGVEDPLYIRGQENLCNDTLRKIPLPEEKAGRLYKRSQSYIEEKQLIYGSLFLWGNKIDEKNQRRPYLIPLLYYPGELSIDSETEVPMLSINPKEVKTNEAAIIDYLGKTDLTNSILEKIPSILNNKGYVKSSQLEKFLLYLKKYDKQLSLQKMTSYPELMAEKELKELQKKTPKEDQNKTWLLPISSVALIKKSYETRGILHELKELSQEQDKSTPLSILLSEPQLKTEKKKEKKEKVQVPIILSRAQETIMEKAKKDPLTLVIGPPGTGKSYTIATVALEHLRRGETVLITSKRDQAVNVIAKVIKNKFKQNHCIVRGGRKQYHKKLITKLDNYLHGIIPGEPYSKEKEETLNNQIKNLQKEIQKTEKQFIKRSAWEKKWGHYLSKGKTSFLLRPLKIKYLKWKVDSSPLYSKTIINLEKLIQNKTENIFTLINQINRKRIEKTLNNQRQDLKKLQKALRARTAKRQEDHFKGIHFPSLLENFPIWCSKLSDLHKILPLEKELFDLAIIDEATQCDCASVLPLFQRAKRVMIVGDPKQLRHISFLSEKTQSNLASKNQLSAQEYEQYNFRNKSILDLVNDTLSNQENISFLDEHYRSQKEIIHFSNQEFYQNALKVMTNKPSLEKEKPALFEIQTAGKRNSKGVNSIEADRILQEVKKQILQEKHLSKELSRSIGIISPFRDQVDHLFEKIQASLSIEEWNKHDLLIGTPYAFQGEEKDIIHLSFALDDSTHNNVFSYLNKEDVFNVSITRGRSEQYIYHSLSKDPSSKNNLLIKYLDFIRSPQIKPTLSQPEKDTFQASLEKALKPHKIETWKNYQIAGLEIDLILSHKNQTIGIDLVGYPGRYEDTFSLERYKMYNRAGLKIYPIAFTEWTYKEEQTLLFILSLFGLDQDSSDLR